MPVAWTSFLAPIYSLMLFTIGYNHLTTLVSINLSDLGYNDSSIGWIQSAYYGGLLLGGIYAERHICRIGHIRAFSAAAGFLTAVILLMSVHVDPVFWFILRFLSGASVAVLYIVIESWLLGKSTPTTRGMVLSIYMVALYLGQSLSQQFLKAIREWSLDPFNLGSVFCALSIIPLAITFKSGPELHERTNLTIKSLFKVSIFGVTGCIIGGVIQGAIYSMVPNFAIHYGFEPATLMTISIAGGFVFQWPIGKLSDLFDRRQVLIITCFLTAIPSVIMLFVPENESLAFFLNFLIAGFSFAIYPVGISQVCDHLDPDQFTAATATMLVCYGIGSVTGPIMASWFMQGIGPAALYFFFVLMSLLLAGVGFYSLFNRPQVPLEEQGAFVAFPGVTPIAYELDPRAPTDTTRVTEEEILIKEEARDTKAEGEKS